MSIRFRRTFAIFLLIVALVIMAACGGSEENVKKYDSTAIAREDSLKAYRAELDLKIQIATMQSVFGPNPEVYPARAILPGARFMEDSLCNAYLTTVAMHKYVTTVKDTTVWRRVGMTLDVAQEEYKDAANRFAVEMLRIVMMPSLEREYMEKSWTHNCRGKLHPGFIRDLLVTATEVLTDAGEPAPHITPAIRNALQKYVEWEIRKTGSHAEAFYWFPIRANEMIEEARLEKEAEQKRAHRRALSELAILDRK